jgi:hypothetical protein
MHSQKIPERAPPEIASNDNIKWPCVMSFIFTTDAITYCAYGDHDAKAPNIRELERVSELRARQNRFSPCMSGPTAVLVSTRDGRITGLPNWSGQGHS